MKNILKRLVHSMGYDIIARPKSGVRQQYTWDKVFCVGANKTGTTSLASVLQDLGIRMPVQSVQETILTRRVLGGDLQIFREFCAPFDAFQDLPFSMGLNFVALDVLFPDAKFILTLRDPEDWFESVCTFQNKVLGIDTSAGGYERSYRDATPYLDDDYATNIMTHNSLRVTQRGLEPDWSKLFDRESYIARYTARNEAIQRHFWGRKGKLLILDVTREPTTEPVVSFLGMDAEHIRPMPHANKTHV